ncbi:Uncharacterised protein [Candidatus Gugararchaeum adminiculabundum]|nr:Uncharacterised protein [Candidatus Gugararchaeum adminiculabundum]
MAIDIPFFKKRKDKPVTEGRDETSARIEEELQVLRRKVKLYRTVIEKYGEQIEEGEKKSVPELRVLVDPENEEVKKISARIIGELGAGGAAYSFGKNFPDAAKKAFEFVSQGLADEQLPVDFWLSPRDMVAIGAGDEMDKALFLCSLLIALGNESAKVIVELSRKHVFVGYEFGKKYFLCDASHRDMFEGSREELVSRHLTTDELVYEFNNKEYDEL